MEKPIKFLYELKYFIEKNKSFKNIVNIYINKIEDYINKYRFIEGERQKIQKKEIPLRIGVVGEFSVGKSTLVNCILEEDILGTGILPKTKRPTHISYGEKIVFKAFINGRIEELEEENYRKLSQHDHNKDRESKRNKIEHFEIKYPCKILKQFEIIDTPGYNSSNVYDEKLIEKWINKSDITLLVLDISKQFTSADKEFLSYSFVKDERIIAVLNKTDQKPPSRHKKIMNSVAKEHSFITVHSLSAKEIMNSHKKNSKNTTTQYDILVGKLDELRKGYTKIKEDSIKDRKQNFEKKIRKDLKDNGIEELETIIDLEKSQKLRAINNVYNKLKYGLSNRVKNIERTICNKVRRKIGMHLVDSKKCFWTNKYKISVKSRTEKEQAAEKIRIKNIVFEALETYYPQKSNYSSSRFEKLIKKYNINIDLKKSYDENVKSQVKKIFNRRNRRCLRKYIKDKIDACLGDKKEYSFGDQKIPKKFKSKLPSKWKKVKNRKFAGKRASYVLDELDKYFKFSGRFLEGTERKRGHIILPAKTKSNPKKYINRHIKDILSRKAIRSVIIADAKKLKEEIKKEINQEYEKKINKLNYLRGLKF